MIHSSRFFTFRPIYEALGLENTLLSDTGRGYGSAPLSPKTKEYFESLGLFLCNTYGSTEHGVQILTMERRKYDLAFMV